jgi:hypothetical protein
MTDQHPITPPPELVEQWREKWSAVCGPFAVYLATQAAQWGADQRGAATEAELQEARDKELDACCLELVDGIGRLHVEFPSCLAEDLRAARRPKPPSLKEQALALVSHDFSDQPCLSEEGYAIIRRALETLDD